MSATIKRAETPWATRGLIDVASAASAATMVAPLITMVDKNASGAAKLGESLRNSVKTLVFRPVTYFTHPSFRLVFGLYFSTYITANTFDSAFGGGSPTAPTVDPTRSDPTTAFSKFLTVAMVNMTLCIYKDKHFTKLFGVTAPKALPLATYALFAARDSLTILASFSLPDIVSAKLQAATTTDGNPGIAPKTASSIAQLVCPCAVQLASTPLHLYGLDLYNNPTAALSQRLAVIRVNYLKSTLARCGRILPAFGFGGIGNKRVREALGRAFS